MKSMIEVKRAQPADVAVGPPTFRMKELPEQERPIEKMQRCGPEGLSDEELIAILLGTGIQRKNALEVATQLIRCGISRTWLLNATVDELRMMEGIGTVKAARIVAGIHLAKRLQEETNFFRIQIRDPRSVATYLKGLIGQKEKEYLYAILLDVKAKPIRAVLLSVGSLSETCAHPREVFQHAVRVGANALILAHNHPSGDPEPSKEDILLTQRMLHAGEILGIALQDHVIVGREGYVSLRERNFMRTTREQGDSW